MLHLEDNPHDRELVRDVLADDAVRYEFTYAANRAEFEAALDRFEPDLILSDFTLPGYNGSAALALAQKKCPAVPYLFVSGTIGEERAVASLREGATDYVLKTNLARLPFAVQRALREADERSRRRQAEAALRQSDERFREMAANIRDAFWITSADGQRLLYLSPAGEQIWGRSIGELSARPSLRIEAIAAEDRERVVATLAQLAGGREYRMEYRISRPDGTMRWVEDRGYPVRHASGRMEQAVGVATDITERKQLQAQLLQAQRMEAIGQLAGGIAHDFNNILTIINGQAALLMDQPDVPREQAEALRQIYTAGERAAGLTRQLLVFSRKQAVRLRPVDLNEIIDEAAKMLRRLIGEHIRLELSLSSRLPCIEADPGMIEQVLMNLALNARDALPQGGRLVVMTEVRSIDDAGARRQAGARPGNFVCLSVCDNGCGIAPEILPQIFEPFFTTKEVGQGTGLGLATAFGVIQQHGGWLAVDSQVNLGTTVQVFLPAIASPAPVSPARPAGAKISGGGETILLVEDDASVREFALAVLQKDGYRVLQAGCGAEALEVWAWHSSRIDLLLTDMVMPNRPTGLELAAKLRAEKPALKVICISGYSRETMDRFSAPSAEMQFMQKPYRPQDLAREVREILDRKTP